MGATGTPPDMPVAATAVKPVAELPNWSVCTSVSRPVVIPGATGAGGCGGVVVTPPDVKLIATGTKKVAPAPILLKVRRIRVPKSARPTTGVAVNRAGL